MLLLVLTALAHFTIADDPVKVSVYYETLCPDSQRFVNNQLYPVFKDLKEIMILDVNAYGKAKDYPVEDSYAFICQHGPKECEGNMMMACVKKSIHNEDIFMGFTDCIMKNLNGTAAGPECAEKHGIEFTPIKDCYTSKEGRILLHEVGVKQKKNAPDLHYVPWILINDIFTEEQLAEAQANLKKVVCDAYTGEKPAGCDAVYKYNNIL